MENGNGSGSEVIFRKGLMGKAGEGAETGPSHFTTSPPGTWLSFQSFFPFFSVVYLDAAPAAGSLVFSHFDFPFPYENF